MTPVIIVIVIGIVIYAGIKLYQKKRQKDANLIQVKERD